MKKISMVYFISVVFSINLLAEVYGAVATDWGNGFSYGWTKNYTSLSAAKNAAIKSCKNAGGVDCKIRTTIKGKSHCLVLRVVNNKKVGALGVATSFNLYKAKFNALEQCLKYSNYVYCKDELVVCNDNRDVKEMFSKKVTSTKKSTSLDKGAVGQAAAYYYNTKGVWAGTFTMDKVEKVRIEGTGTYFTAHIKYKYRPLPGVSRSAGSDYRTFRMKKLGSNSFKVLRMGEFQSARF